MRVLLLVVLPERLRHALGRVRAWRTQRLALRRVPAYRRHLTGRAAHRWSALPETDKRSYIQRHPIEDLCLDGRLPRRGVVVDESSGSSGTPTSWVRGPAERRATAALLRATFARATKGRPVIVLNAFALGAWATGMNVSMALADVCILKSTGPDRDKVLDTIRAFGPAYDYVVLAYPPFLKDLADDPRLDLAEYRVMAGFGGEGISENMRTYLERSFTRVVGSYGASDLEINLAAETEFAVALRRELAVNPGLRAALTRDERGVAPMVFQYDPLSYLMESNADGELLVTVCRPGNLSPRIRYNIHDVGHVARFGEVAAALRRHGAAHLLSHARLSLPLLFHYGRSDASVDFYGAVVAPDSVREIIYGRPDLAAAFAAFRLITYEDATSSKRLLFAVELAEGRDVASFDEEALSEHVLSQLRARNGDFANATRIAADGAAPTLQLFATGTGPFARDTAKLKQTYVAQLDREQAQLLGLAT